MLRRLLRRPPITTLSSLTAYAQWASSYPPYAHNPLMQTEERAVLSLMPPLSGLTILDLACGTGRYGRLALENGAAQVIGLDNSPSMLRQHASKTVVLASLEAIPLPANAVDGVVCALALGHLPRLAPSLMEISRVLKPEGWALISDFHPFLSLTGAKRTFSAPDGNTYAVEHYTHLYEDYHRAAQQAGLRLTDVREPRLDPAPHAPPVVLVLALRKG